jgi:cytochrome b561
MLSNPATRYGGVALTAHWLTVLLLAGSFTLGYVMTDMAISPTKLKLFSYHKWIGVTIFGLVALRLLWRLFVTPPALPATMAAWERRLASLTHGLLYALLFAVPLSGWLMSSAKGFQTVYFGVWPIPDLLGKDKALAGFFEATHEFLTSVMLGLVALHAVAALKHHFINRDGVLLRMLPSFRSPERLP